LIDAEETRSVSASDVETNYTGTGTINNFRVGARKVADRVYEPLQTDFAELIIYDRRLDDAELADVTAYLSSKYLHPLVGDLNSDHVVDRKDVVRMLQSYGAYTSAGDLNGDGFIGLADLATLQANFGATSGSPAPSAAAVPEPSGLGLLVCGVLALAGTSIRRRGDKGDR
jgi:hypothetical protein